MGQVDSINRSKLNKKARHIVTDVELNHLPDSFRIEWTVGSRFEHPIKPEYVQS